MSKRLFSLIGLAVLMVLLTGVLSAATPMPVTTFTLVQGLPAVMNVGETAIAIVQVESDMPFNSVHASPSFQFPGKGVVAVEGRGPRRFGHLRHAGDHLQSQDRYLQNAGRICAGVLCGGRPVWRRICGGAGVSVQRDGAVVAIRLEQVH